MPLADYFAEQLGRARVGQTLPIGPIALVAHQVANGRVTSVGLRLAEPDQDLAPTTLQRKIHRAVETIKRLLHGMWRD
jgi:hypothetical protein